MKIVIIGGVAGGASAAARLRRLDETAEIIMLERTGYVSYANCGLPYYTGGVIEDRRELTLQTPESFWERFRIDARVRHEAVAVNPQTKTVTVTELETGRQYEESYDKLIISTGAKPIQPVLTGLDETGEDTSALKERIFTLRTVEDTLRIRDFVEVRKPRSAVIAGGGYIGVEVAENLAEMGIHVTIVQKPNQLLAPLDYDMATFVHAQARKHGIDLKLGRAVSGIEKTGEGLRIHIGETESVEADMVIMAVGVTPDTKLAETAGLKLGIKGSIVVNDRMETSIEDIYAVGDAVEVSHYVTGKRVLISLAGPANKQGRIAADNICGLDSTYAGSQGSSILKFFELTIATTGINEREAKASGIDYDKVILSPASHASYYPGAMVMTMKVVFEKETQKLLGAQIVGYDSVDKRIDVLATAIHAGIRADKLKDLDLAYAPPYSSAKDPVNMAGFMIENICTGKMKQFHYDEIERLVKDDSVTLLDTRTLGEYAYGHVDGFINIPLDDVRERLAEIPKGKPVYVMCQSGLRSYIACRILMQNGYDCYNFSGGYRFMATVLREQQMACATFPCGMEKQ